MSETPTEFRRIRKAMGLRQVDLAAMLGVTQATVSRWDAGIVEADTRTMIALKALQAVRAAVPMRAANDAFEPRPAA